MSSETRTGMVRTGVGGEHPTLGLLTPGQVVDVPAGLWSDELFAPCASQPAESAAPAVPVVDGTLLVGLDERIAAAETTLAGVAGEVARAEALAAKAPAVQAAMDELRRAARRIAERQAAIAARRAEIAAELETLRRDLATDMLAAEEAARALTTLLAPAA